MTWTWNFKVKDKGTHICALNKKKDVVGWWDDKSFIWSKKKAIHDGFVKDDHKHFYHSKLPQDILKLPNDTEYLAYSKGNKLIIFACKNKHISEGFGINKFIIIKKIK